MYYYMAQMFDRGKLDEFDESKLHYKNFPYQYFTYNLSASACIIYGSCGSVYQGAY